jgi:hypothetical protein
MFASWDCKHFSWKNCPVTLAGQHKGKESDKTLILEAIADADLYIWYHFFGEAGSLNDINILNKSSILGSILDGSFDLKTNPYTINGTTHDWLYFLVDGIYPAYSIFITAINHPQSDMEKHFSTCQEACQKDIKHAFGVLVKQFQILQRPIKSWYWQDIVDIMDMCIIMHNMIVESHCELFSVSEYMQSGQVWYAATDTFHATNNNNNDNNNNNNNNNQQPPTVTLFGNKEENVGGNILIEADLATRIAIHVAHLNESIKNQQEHFSLKNDLMSHLWERKQHRSRCNYDNDDDENMNNDGGE